MKMALTLTLLFSLILLTTTSNAFDITQILNQYPSFSTFNSYLTQTNLAAEINSRQTITVLVVDNGSISPVSAKPLDEIKNILSVHVILDYLDAAKLQQLAATSALVTTLFQASGLARGQQGFLSLTSVGGGTVAFGSAMPGSPTASTFVSSVFSLPYNISVIQVSGVIVPQGIDGSKISSPPSISPPASSVPTPPPPPSSATGASATPPQPSSATGATPPQPSSATGATATPPPSAATGATPPPPSSATGATATPPPSSATAATPPPSSATGATPPPSSATAATPPPQSPVAGATPAAAPPQASSSSGAVPSAAPTKASSAPVPSTAPTTAAGPPAAISASPASSPAANTPATTASTDTPATEEAAGTTTPAAEKPKGKSAAASLDAGVFTVLLSTLCLAMASRI